ncbi:MAG: hypothetical protein H7Z10_13400, partial [Gemmatimonadaceae bacterium]|nr:hypothetical protein [Acetobacteraceae bacterium]
IPGVRVAGLQRGPGETAPWVSHLWGASMDILDTARQIATVDVVVTIDTMVAHLAGALGRPTWLLLQRDADWRWMTGRRDSPWYGSCRLYRQARAGCWADPVAQVVRDLSALAREPQGVSAFVGCMNDRHRA